MAVDDGNLDHIMDLQDLNLGDIAALPNFNEFQESQLCVPPDPIEDLEWFPSFSDDFISLNESSLNHHQPPDDENLIECNFPATPEQHERDEKTLKMLLTKGSVVMKKDWVGISEAELGSFTRKKARTKKKCLEGNQKAKGKINWERNLKRCSHCETEETPQWRVGCWWVLHMGPTSTVHCSCNGIDTVGVLCSYYARTVTIENEAP